MADYSDAFAETEQKYGLPPGYLARTYQLEGTTKNPRSSADGPFQFIDSTARAYGLKDKHNLAEATDAAARLARDNAAALRSALGRDPTAAELYLAHQQGSGGAIKMLSNPNATVGGDAIANNGGQPGMTGGAFANKWTSKFDGSPSLPPMLQPPQQSAAPSMAQSYAPQDEQQGGLGGFFNDPQKLVALAALAKVFDPWGKDQTPALLQAMQLKQQGQEKKAQQDALVLALTRSGMDERTARALAASPAAAQMGMTQQSQRATQEADRAAAGLFGPGAPTPQPAAQPPQAEQPAPFPAPLPGRSPGATIPELPPQQPGPMSLAQYGGQMMTAQGADENTATPAASTPTAGVLPAPSGLPAGLVDVADRQRKAADFLARYPSVSKERRDQIDKWANPTAQSLGEGYVLQEGKIVRAYTPEEKSPTSVAEYKYYRQNLAPDEKPLDYATFSSAKARAGATNISNNIDMNSGQTYDKQLAEGLGKAHSSLANGVEDAQTRARDVAAMQGAVDAIQKNGGTTGGLAPAQRLELQKSINAGASAIGIEKPFSESDLSDKEFLTKFNRSMAGAQAKNAVGSRVTNFEMSNFLKANPGLDMTITGNQRLLGIQAQIEQRNIAVGNAIRDETAKAISAGKKIDPVTVQKIITAYDEEHHIKDPVSGQDLTQSYTLPEFQKLPGNERPTEINSNNMQRLKSKYGLQ